MTLTLVAIVNLLLTVVTAVRRIPFRFRGPGGDEPGWRKGGGDQTIDPLAPTGFETTGKRWRSGAGDQAPRVGSSGQIARRRCGRDSATAPDAATRAPVRACGATPVASNRPPTFARYRRVMPQSRPDEPGSLPRLARDAGLRRLSRLTRRTVAVAVALTGAFAAVAAHALPGRSPNQPARATTVRPAPAPTRAPARRQVAPTRLRSTGGHATTPAPPPLQPPQQAPTPTPAPPVVVSGGS